MLLFSPMQMNFLGFKVNAVDNSSVVNAGSLQYIDQFVTYKRNQGVGEQNGDFSPINIPISSFADPDVVDSSSVKNSVV